MGEHRQGEFQGGGGQELAHPEDQPTTEDPAVADHSSQGARFELRRQPSDGDFVSLQVLQLNGWQGSVGQSAHWGSDWPLLGSCSLAAKLVPAETVHNDPAGIRRGWSSSRMPCTTPSLR